MQCDTTVTHKNAEVKKYENNQVGRDIELEPLCVINDSVRIYMHYVLTYVEVYIYIYPIEKYISIKQKIL